MSEHVGHINASFGLARRLQQRGHNVAYVGSGASSSLITDQGFVFERVSCLQPLPVPRLKMLRILVGRRRPPSVDWSELLGRMQREVKELILNFSPRLLIFDPFLLLYYMAFWPHRVPAAVLSANMPLDYDPAVPPYTSSVIPSQSRWSRVRVWWAWQSAFCRYAIHRLCCRAQLLLEGNSSFRLARTVAAEFDFPLENERIYRPVSFDFCLRSVPELVLSIPGFDFPRALPIRQAVQFIGPAIHLGRNEPEFDWSILPNRPFLVYASLGTIELPWLLPRREAFLRTVINAFRTLDDCSLLIACGASTSVATFDPLPRNVAVVHVAPQLRVLRRATLFLSHAGANSVKESILLGVPLLVYPRRADQPGNAARVVFHGLGLRGDPDRETAVGLAQKVRRILGNPEYRENVGRMRSAFLDSEADEQGVLTVESLFGSTNTHAS